MSKLSRTSLTGSHKTRCPGTKTLPPGLESVLQCTCGHYPWDDWEKAALAAGVPKDLTSLGRETMREAYQHGWIEALQVLCGWNDGGKRMIRLALRSPEKARKRWKRLLSTDGYRGQYDQTTGEWKSWL